METVTVSFEVKLEKVSVVVGVSPEICHVLEELVHRKRSPPHMSGPGQARQALSHCVTDSSLLLSTLLST